MSTDPEPHAEKNGRPAKPGRLELLVMVVFLLFVAWGTYEFGVWIIKDGGIPSKETERPF